MRPPPIETLFATPDTPGLGPLPRRGVLPSAQVSAQVHRFAADSSMDAGRAELLRALALLWHDHLDEAHGIVDGAPGPDAAFVHGIMHRREPDYSNARYWFQRVGEHPLLEPLAEAAAPILAAHAALPYRLIREGRWDPFAFIDAVAAATRRKEAAREAELLRELQQQESLVLARHLASG